MNEFNERKTDTYLYLKILNALKKWQDEQRLWPTSWCHSGKGRWNLILFSPFLFKTDSKSKDFFQIIKHMWQFRGRTLSLTICGARWTNAEIPKNGYISCLGIQFASFTSKGLIGWTCVPFVDALEKVNTKSLCPFSSDTIHTYQ